MKSDRAENPNELEIVSIGSLYRGPWDKKYWSCSRGKERYPYPIGYHAVRTHCGNVYQMEVHEGQKGPLFIVTADDGSSFSGQTPDIAWVNLHRACFKVKNCNMKGFSSKIDVAEIFGFKNPSVQRLLRELVNNSNMDEENSLPPSFFHNKVMEFNNKPLQTSEKHVCLETSVEKLQFYKRRTKKRNSTEGACIPNHHNISKGDMLSPAIDDNTTGLKIQNDADIVSFGSCVRNEETCLPLPQGRELNFYSIPAGKMTEMGLNLSDCVIDKHIISQEESNGVCHETYRLPPKPDNRHDSKKLLLDRCPDARIEQLNPSSYASKFDHEDFLTLPNCSNICVTNTSETFTGNIDVSTLDHVNEKFTFLKNDLVEVKSLLRTSKFHSSEIASRSECKYLNRSEACASDPTHSLPYEGVYSCCIPKDNDFQEVAKDSLPEMGSSGSSGTKLEDVIMDLADRELALSMMGFLLPRAVPLIKKTYVRRHSRARLHDSSCDPCTEGNSVQSNTNHRHNAMCQEKLVAQKIEERLIEQVMDSQKSGGQANYFCADTTCMTNESFPENGGSKDSNSVVPDSFDNDQCSCGISLKENFYTNFDERNLTNPNKLKGNCTAKSLSISNVQLNDFQRCDFQNDAENPEVLAFDKKDGEVISNSLADTIDPGDDTPSAEESIGESIKCTLKRGSSIEIINFDVNGKFKEETINGKNKHYPCLPSTVSVTEGVLLNTAEAQNFCSAPPSLVQYNASLLEGAVCPYFDDSNVSETNFATNSLLAPAKDQARSTNHNVDSRTMFYKVGTEEQNDDLKNGQDASEIGAQFLIPAVMGVQCWDTHKKIMQDMEAPNQTLYVDVDKNITGVMKVKKGMQQITAENGNSVHLELPHINLPLRTLIGSNEPVLRPPSNNIYKDLSYGQFYNTSFLDGSLSNEDRLMEIIGCYLHPDPVLYVMLNSKGNHLQLCVLCGFPDAISRYLFLYSIPLQGQLRGCPSFLGYTSLLLPLVSSRWNGNIPFERSALCFASDGKSFIFVSSIKAPRCREQNINCFCSSCKLECPSEMNLEIAHINFGYVSRITTLTTNGRIICISVCEPNYVVAVEDSGALHIWVLNFTWSECLEEFMLPNIDFETPMAVELMSVPGCHSLIIGHNGISDLFLWDISKRVLLAKFSSPGNRVCQIVPVSLFNWQSNAGHERNSAMHIKQNIQKANCEFSSVSSSEEIAVWILISVAVDSEMGHEVQELGTSPVGLWRLALLVNNMIITGSIFDPRATAACASAESGIIGTSDGFFYKWELSSGRILAKLTSTQCCISCMTLDAQSGALAVGSIDGNLQVLIEPEGLCESSC
ncbi:hypothetical protein HPP92_000888 [Vanilla planifolia]|uniref:FYR C-terminal domain-containing protein n=1 Tax=Vanilla planifolia TaxID=51239 RepID=A0A835S2B1_VANPL|nr:hypothetical protein HPP92_000888 [Vanilla planifolia]